MLLTDELIKSGILKTPAIIRAFRNIERKDFLRPEDAEAAEIDAPIQIGRGQTNSQPTTVGLMLELLAPRPGEKILDVGCGSGWTTALLAEIVKLPENTGKKESRADLSGPRVYALELIGELADFARQNVEKYGFISQGIAAVLQADGYKGLPEAAPFDKILVSAAAREVPPELLGQLKTGGKMVIPLGNPGQAQELAIIEKTGKNKFREKKLPGFIFVPLIKK